MKIRALLVAATCMALPLAAHAQPVTGPYITAEAGTSIASGQNYSFNDSFGGTRDYIVGKNNYRPSYAGVVGFGYGFGNGFRVQVDGDFSRYTRHNTTIGVQLVGGPTENIGKFAATGGADRYGPMVNVLYDIPVDFPVIPYVGGGVGYQWVKLNSSFPLIPELPFDDGINSAGTRGSFAYDIIAGAAYNLPWVPGLALTAEYRFSQLTQSVNYHLNAPTNSIPPGAATEVKFGQLSTHTFLLGVRYQIFNPPPAVATPAPAPAPVAAPAPAPARTFIVFFDWDKATLTPRATEIISEAASDSKTSNVTTLDVSGYTDTSGTPDYNMGLSQRRAEAVAAKLEADGVAASEIEIHAYGETHLLVATGPGVREPQNRRVEIVLQ